MSLVSSLGRAIAERERRDQPRSRGFIVGPLYDGLFFIAAPPIALVLGLLLAGSPLDEERVLFGEERSPLGFLLGVFIFAHLVIVLFRSHLNPRIFRLHPYRFTLVPLLLFIAMGSSTWVLVTCLVLATFWDVYHSGMQTFGLARIYDARAGNPPLTGRRLDWALNILLYAGPIAAGATMMDHVEDFEEFEEVGSLFFTSIPAYAESHAQFLTWAVIGICAAFLGYYLFANWRFHRAGHRVSKQKVALLAGTALCSIYAWGFNPFGMAFFIMNFFHALQYFAIVWWTENGNIAKSLGLARQGWGKPAAFAVLLGVGLAYGVFAEMTDPDAHPWLFNLFLVVSLMHFWYDGFIWSVRRKQV
jgi:hypothetical protein